MTRPSLTQGYLHAILGSCLGSVIGYRGLTALVSPFDHSPVLSTPIALAYVLGALLGALGGCWLALAWSRHRQITSTLIPLLGLLPIAAILAGLLTSFIYDFNPLWTVIGGSSTAAVLARWLAVRRSAIAQEQ